MVDEIAGEEPERKEDQRCFFADPQYSGIHDAHRVHR